MDGKFRKMNKPNHGPTIEWFGGECPVTPGNAVTVMFRSSLKYSNGYWQPVSHPERLNWQHTGGHRKSLSMEPTK
jgi:hypothetical protein